MNIVNKTFLGAVLVGSSLQGISHFYKTKLILTYKETDENEKIINNCFSLALGKYRPTYFLPTAFMQMVYGAKIDKSPYFHYQPESLKLSDGGSVTLDWGPLHEFKTKKLEVPLEEIPVVVIFHGLTGGSDSNYIKHAVKAFFDQGYRTVVMNNRGTVNSPLTTPYFKSGAAQTDVQETVEYVKSRFPNAPIFGLGISLGANLLTNYVGESGEDAKFDAFVSISNPFDAYLSVKALLKTRNKVFHNFIFGKTIDGLKNNIDVLKKNQLFDIEKVINESKNLIDLDKNLTIKMLGFRTTDEFYRHVSSTDRLKSIKKPGLFINSKDDPICVHQGIPFGEFRANENIIHVLTQKGGHIDYFYSRKALRVIVN